MKGLPRARCIACALILCIFPLLLSVSHGSSETPPQPGVAHEPVPPSSLETSAEYASRIIQQLDQAKDTLDQIEVQLQQETPQPELFDTLYARISNLSRETRAVIADIAPRLQEANTRLRLLGEAPANSTGVASEQLAEKRQTQEKIQANFLSVETQARLNMVRINQLQERIDMARWTLFTNRIFERQRSVLNLQLWYDAVRAFPIFEHRVAALISGDSSPSNPASDRKAILLSVLLLLASILTYMLLHRVVSLCMRLYQPPEYISSLHRNLVAAGILCLYVLLPLLLLSIFYGIAIFGGFITDPKKTEVTFEVLGYLVVYSSMVGTVIAVLRPDSSAWRLVSLDDRTANHLAFLLRSIAIIYTIGNAFNSLNSLLLAPLIITIVKEALISILIIIFLTTALITLAKARNSSQERWHWPAVCALSWVGDFILILSLLFGFLSLASFLSSQMVIAAATLTILRISTRLSDAFLMDDIESRSPFSHTMQFLFAISPQTIIQIGIIAAGFVRVLLICCALAYLGTSWGLRPYSEFGWFESLVPGLSIDGPQISLVSSAIGILLFLVGIIITKSVKRWLDQGYLPHTSLDIGIRNSIKTAFGYCGYLLATIIGLGYAGLDLSNIAIVAGALSVGIGFGLQSIVNNFVSGLILLVERPIKAGDWIIAGNAEGYVRKISVRATEIETFSRASVIIPNSLLISDPVTNFTHDNRVGRTTIAIRTSYGKDPQGVRDILLQCAADHPSVLTVPAPQAFLVEFGEYSLNFELRVFMAFIDDAISVGNDLRLSIFDAFLKNDIEIPCPKTDIVVHRKGGKRPLPPTQAVVNSPETGEKRAGDSGPTSDPASGGGAA